MAANTTSTGGSSPNAHSNSKPLMLSHTRYAIYLTVSFIGALTVYRLAFYILTNVAPRLSSPHAPDIEHQDKDRSKSLRSFRLRRVPAAVLSFVRVFFCRVTISFGFGASMALGDLLVTLGYLAAMLSFEFINARDATGALSPSYWANRAGLLVVSQLTFIVALAGKDNIVSLLTGIGYEKLNIYHRMCSRALLILSWIHFSGWVKQGLTGKHAIGKPMINTGLTALVSFTLAVLLGTKQVRNASYEVFLVGHIILVCTFLLNLHYHIKAYPYTVYLWPCYGVWILDRFLRLARALYIRYLSTRSSTGKGKATIKLVSSDTVSVKLRLARGALMKWQPGQSAYLTIPSVSKYIMEAHPFTIASISEPVPSGEREVELLFIVRACDGFTRRLLHKTIAGRGELSVPAFASGPYGTPPAMHVYHKVILIAGGSGVSFTLPLLLDFIRRARSQISAIHPRKATFIWFVRHKEHVTWIQDTLQDWISPPNESIKIDLRIYITGREDTDIQDELPPSELTSENCSEKEKNTDEQSISAYSIQGDDTKISNEGTARISVVRGRPNMQDLLKDQLTSDMSGDSVGVAG